MAAEYDFQRKPNPKGDGELQPMYPRIVNKGTITGKRLVSDISQATSFTPGDVEGVLAALESRISYYLSEGHHVQLGNMGHFSAGLTARPVMDKKEIHAQTIFFGKVHFRVSPGFRKQCAGFVERVRAGYGFRHSEDISGSDRAMPSYFGGIVSAPWINMGKVKNRGYELELRINKTLRNSLHLWANMNMTHAVNEIIEADDPEL